MSRTNEATAAIGDGPLTPVTRLIPGFHEATPVQLLQETLEYATSPKNYLIRRLGKDVVEQRSKLLSVPPELVDTDTYGKGVHKQRFEQHISGLLGKKHGLFFITGVQAQLSAIRVHCNKVGNDRVAWH